jgi:hypothetical protein
LKHEIRAYRRQIDAALQYAGGSHTFEDVCEKVEEGKMQFWPGRSSVVITEILEYPRKRTLNIFLAGGDLSEIEHMAPLILDWGKTQGCVDACFIGRPGWERSFLSRTGWTKANMIVLERTL